MTTNLRHYRLIAVSILLGIILCGCGLRGDLYLPDEVTDDDRNSAAPEVIGTDTDSADQTEPDAEDTTPADTSTDEPESDQDEDNDDPATVTEDGEYDSVAPPLP